MAFLSLQSPSELRGTMSDCRLAEVSTLLQEQQSEARRAVQGCRLSDKSRVFMLTGFGFTIDLGRGRLGLSWKAEQNKALKLFV